MSKGMLVNRGMESTRSPWKNVVNELKSKHNENLFIKLRQSVEKKKSLETFSFARRFFRQSSSSWYFRKIFTSFTVCLSPSPTWKREQLKKIHVFQVFFIIIVVVINDEYSTHRRSQIFHQKIVYSKMETQIYFFCVLTNSYEIIILMHTKLTITIDDCRL